MVTAVDGIHFETRHWPYICSASPSKERFPQPDATLVQLPFSDTQKAAQFQTAAAVDNDENNQIVKVEISGARGVIHRPRPTDQFSGYCCGRVPRFGRKNRRENIYWLREKASVLPTRGAQKWKNNWRKIEYQDYNTMHYMDWLV